MAWLILFAGSLAGGVLSAAARQNPDSVGLRLLSFFVPFGCTAWFWYRAFRAGNMAAQFDAFFGTAGSGSLTAKIVTAAVSCLVCWLLCKLAGVLIVKYIESK